MSTQHTPGPWTIADHGVFAQTINAHGNFYVCALPFPTEEPSPEDQANLRLIAAAPDLLEYLSKTIEALEYWLPRYGDALGAESAMIKAARAAINKATQPPCTP